MTVMSVALVMVPGAAAQDDVAKKVAAGERIYNTYCMTCHGESLASIGATYDLRRLRADERPRFESSVLNGKGQMPPWKGVVSDMEIEFLWHYIRANTTAR